MFSRLCLAGLVLQQRWPSMSNLPCAMEARHVVTHFPALLCITDIPESLFVICMDSTCSTRVRAEGSPGSAAYAPASQPASQGHAGSQP